MTLGVRETIRNINDSNGTIIGPHLTINEIKGHDHSTQNACGSPLSAGRGLVEYGVLVFALLYLSIFK